MTFAITDPIATRGERLVLGRAEWSTGDQRGDAFHSELLVIVEIDADERVAARVLFDPNDIDAAFEELETRYLAGEAAAHAQAWSLMIDAYAADMDVSRRTVAERIRMVVPADGAFFDLDQFEPESARDIAILYEARAGALAANPEFEVRSGVSRYPNRFVSGPGLLVRRREGKS